ncbi:MAG: hypothetical protein FJ148_25470 [Deltaproteobacteria bacterium]|nr:hypothetical protein [Deltaproteobacteria bacterium]
MQLTRRYLAASAASWGGGGVAMSMSTDVDRDPACFDGVIGDGESFARAMLALHEVVRSDLRRRPRDHSSYQAWVHQQYLDEIGAARATRLASVQREIKRLNAERSALAGPDMDIVGEFLQARNKFWQWLAKHDFSRWIVLDPVVSVHDDAILFEAFSLDESSYARVSVPTGRCQQDRPLQRGTTNIDFGPALARELERVRRHRPVHLRIGGAGGNVAVSTDAGSAVESKIDLPDSWPRGFVEVQAAMAMPGVTLRLDVGVLSRILAYLRMRNDGDGPRALRFCLQPGERPRIVLEPWGVEVREPEHVYEGSAAQELRIWGRRRLLVLERLLPDATSLRVRLLGTGMPSFWSVDVGAHRFDLGLSGWTRNDWTRGASFAAMSASADVDPKLLKRLRRLLESEGTLVVADAARRLRVRREQAGAALHRLCCDGYAMADEQLGGFRWRDLFTPEEREQLRNRAALDPQGDLGEVDLHEPVEVVSEEQGTSGVGLELKVRDVGEYRVRFVVDPDGRVVEAVCDCPDYAAHGLQHGPCRHLRQGIMALRRREIAR